MSNLGKWGVTRDDDGKLAVIWEWPWYWRYPTGIAVLCAAGWMLYSAPGDGTSWKSLIVPGLGALIALSLMYELGCLVVVLAVGAILWWGVAALFPGLNSELSPQTASAIALGAAVWAWILANEARKESERNSRRIEALARSWSDQVESDRAHRGDLYEDIHEVRARLEKLEDDDIGVDWR